MPLLRYLQHWLTGRGPCLQVADFVPETHPLRQWAETFPWAALVAAVDRSFAQRFPKPTTRGRPPVSTRVLLALELLKHELACSDEQICSRLRTDLAVMYACGISEVQVDGSQEHFVLPEVLAQFRSRLDEPLMEELLAIQAAAAMEEGLVSPAHLVVDTFPSEQGSQRVNDAATLYKAQKKSSRSSRPSPRQCATRGTALQAQAQQLQHDLQKMMRRFGRQCRGMGKVFVTLVRQTETQLLAMGRAGPAAGAGRPGAPARRAAAVGGAAGAPGHPAHGRARGPSPDRTPIPPADAGQGVAPLQNRQRLRSHHCPHLQRQEQLPHPVWPQARDYRRASRGLHLCPASARGQSQ